MELLQTKKIRYEHAHLFSDILSYNELPGVTQNLLISKKLSLFSFFKKLVLLKVQFFYYKDIKNFFVEYNPVELFITLLPFRTTNVLLNTYAKQIYNLKTFFFLNINKKKFFTTKKKKGHLKVEFINFYMFFFKHFVLSNNVFKFIKLKKINTGTVGYYQLYISRAAFSSAIKYFLVTIFSNLIKTASSAVLLNSFISKIPVLFSHKKNIIVSLFYYWKFFVQYCKFFVNKQTKFKKRLDKRLLKLEKRVVRSNLKRKKKIKKFFRIFEILKKRKIKISKKRKKILASLKIKKVFKFLSMYKLSNKSLVIFIYFQKN